MDSCELKFCAGSRYQNSYTIGCHTHPCWELIYYIDGEGTTVLDKEKHLFSKDTFSLVSPECSHIEIGTPGTQVLYIGFTLHKAFPLKAGLYSGKTFPILPLLEKIAAEMRSGLPFASRMMNLLTQEIVLLLSRTATPQKESDKIALIEYAKNYIELNYMNHIRIKDLAQNIGYSYDYFRHVFLKMVGMTAKDYLMQTQLKHAKEQLLLGKSIKEIAAACGYASDAHFCNLFKQEVGQSPGEFVSTCTEVLYPQIMMEFEEQT